MTVPPLWLSVPNFQMADVSTYPLRVVEDRAVNTWCCASSACTTEPRLTTPAAAKTIVHLLHFIFVPPAMFGLVSRFYASASANPLCPAAPKTVQLTAILGKSPTLDNKYFGSTQPLSRQWKVAPPRSRRKI